MSRKGENIYKRKDGRWEGRYIKSRTPAGKPQYGYIYSKTYRETKALLIKAISEEKGDSGRTRDKQTGTFLEAAEEWLQSSKPQLKESTCNKYRNLLQNYVYPEFGNLPLYLITQDAIELHCKQLLLAGGQKKSGLSSKTVSDTMIVMNNVIRFADRTGKYLSCSPHLVRVKVSSREMRVLSTSEQGKLCRYLCSDRNAYNVGILVCLFTGLRIGEICALRWEDISFSDQTIHIHQTMQRIQNYSGTGPKTKIVITTPKSPCSIRTIPIPEELVSILISHQVTASGFLLTNSTTRYIEPRTMQNHFKKALYESGITDANFHSLRHTFATRCVELGFDVKSLSEILGHANVNITLNRYVHPSMELKKHNMQRLSKLFAVK